MGKQYITTNTVSSAHSLDILDLAVVSKYTITVGSDGYAKFWDNKLDEIADPKHHVIDHLIDATGIHHINVYENTMNIGGEHVKVIVIGYGCFSGNIRFQFFVNDDLSTLTGIETPDSLIKGSWTPVFCKDPASEKHLMVASQIDGNVVVYHMDFAGNKHSLEVKFDKQQELASKEQSFPISIDVTQTDSRYLAVGYTNGDVLMYTLDNLKVLYTFHSTDLQVLGSGSSSIPRVVKFSPGGSLLAVARDNQNSGSITLYDVKYGENIGSLTKPSHSSSATIGGFAHDGWIMGLSFDDEGKLLASCGFDKCVRIWDLESKEREATLTVSVGDFDLNDDQEILDNSIVSGVYFIKKGIRGGLGGDNNDGICAISFDRGIRWYREAGGI